VKEDQKGYLNGHNKLYQPTPKDLKKEGEKLKMWNIVVLTMLQRASKEGNNQHLPCKDLGEDSKCTSQFLTSVAFSKG
jgi:hypothetical protein